MTKQNVEEKIQIQILEFLPNNFRTKFSILDPCAAAATALLVRRMCLQL